MLSNNGRRENEANVADNRHNNKTLNVHYTYHSPVAHLRGTSSLRVPEEGESLTASRISRRRAAATRRADARAEERRAKMAQMLES